MTIDPSGVTITDADGAPISRDEEVVTWNEDAAEKGGYETFMLKEIHEQPDAVAETIGDRVTPEGTSTSPRSSSQTSTCATSGGS